MKQDADLFDYDILIAGGGMVGASLACALGQVDWQGPPLRIAVLEAAPFDSHAQPSFDARTVALAQGSQRIFEVLGLWHDMEQRGVTPIARIHVSDRGHMGSAHLDCREQGTQALGYVAETRVIGQALHARLAQLDTVDVICPAEVTEVEFAAAHVRVTVSEGELLRELTARLLVAADGGQSFIRSCTGIKTFTLNYGQSALIANVACDRPHHNIAYERFTDHGPMALLPTFDHEGGDNLYALVWTEAPHRAEELAGLDDEAFLQQLRQRFGRRAGNFIRVGTRHVYPLRLLQTREHVRPRLAIIGNAAHTLHPVSGQGFNLGLRDAAVLAQVVADGWREQRDPGDMHLLREYAEWRKRDQLQTTFATDGLVRVFSTGFPPLALARNLGLLALDIMPPLKRLFARHAMGYTGKLPRLARGLPL